MSEFAGEAEGSGSGSRRHLGVGFAVLAQVREGTESAIAQRARVRLVTAVCARMLRETCRQYKAATTHAAHKRTLVAVKPLVVPQVRNLPEALTALGALKIKETEKKREKYQHKQIVFNETSLFMENQL